VNTRANPSQPLVERSARVMIVDDEPLNMEVLQIHLESEGYSRFTCLSDSRETIERMRAEPPDVLLLDLMMPHVSGFDILEALAGETGLSDVPVIVLTSSDDAETKLRALRLGATDFLSKPVDASELALRMRNTLTARSWQKRRSRFDALTELPNQSCFVAVLQNELVRAGNGPGASPASPGRLSLINIRQFKSVNDSFGSKIGDQVLWTVRERLIAAFGRNPDEVVDELSMGPDRDGTSCIARLGADRFAVYTPSGHGDPTGQGVCASIERFLRAFGSALQIGDERLYLNASVGVARLIDDGENVPDVLNAADTAMRQAGDRYASGYALYAAEMDVTARKRLSMENGLRTAISDGGIFLTYQPKLCVATNEIMGAEALVRWQHPRLGLISPVDFIPLAEHNGTIVPIGEWVMREACVQAVQWAEAAGEGFRMAVNVSIRQLQEEDFVATVRRVLDDTGMVAACLVIELTENMIMDDAEANMVKLERLREIGVKLSIDDFGTGYSSLAYLQRFAIDQLKIDQSFVREIEGAASRAPIVKAIVSLAHDLGLSVVAEGVETHHQLAKLRSLRCEEYQGYLASRPVTSEAFEQLLRDGCPLEPFGARAA